MIVFIDDDRRYINDYIEELESRGYSVHHKYNIDNAFEFVIENHQKIEILVLDIMMPPGNLLKNKDEDNGRRTGIYFVQALKNQLNTICFPLVIFTHVNTNHLDLDFVKFQKEDYNIFEFADKIEQIINSGI